MAFQVTEVQRVLKGADYPMDGRALAALAAKNGAGDDLTGALETVGRANGPVIASCGVRAPDRGCCRIGAMRARSPPRAQ